MAVLAQQRCLNHDSREAACRCPLCQKFFCRECVVLFEARLLCANCLAMQAPAQEPGNAKRRLSFASLMLALLGLLLVWLMFYLAGWAIFHIHESDRTASPGSLWIAA